jgi:EAL domain-containing protein (putative c-di-GMP-specific phosphodiesterase class I)
MLVVGEGIETAEQLSELRGLGCDYGQGFFLARPGPPEQIEPLLMSPETAPEGANGHTPLHAPLAAPSARA